MHALLSIFTTGSFLCKVTYRTKSWYFLCDKDKQSSRNFKCEVMGHFLKETNQKLNKWKNWEAAHRLHRRLLLLFLIYPFILGLSLVNSMYPENFWIQSDNLSFTGEFRWTVLKCFYLKTLLHALIENYKELLFMWVMPVNICPTKKDQKFRKYFVHSNITNKLIS